MDIGIGTYALFWEGGPENPQRLTLEDMLDRAAELDCRVVQICDDPRIEDCDPVQLAALRDRARDLDLRLELGTRTIGREHMGRYLDIADALDVRILRSMVQSHEVAGGLGGAVTEIAAILLRLEAQDVTLALETYEQIPTGDLLEIIGALGTDRVGICLDPANCVSALELPRDVVELTAAHVVDLHVKDFRFDRQEGWVGFTFSGARMGEGLLDLDHEIATLRQAGRDPAAVIEHWLPWQGDLETTIRTEREWTLSAIEALRSRL